MKDKSFEIENEWRIVSQPFNSPPDYIEFRDGRFNVTPYYNSSSHCSKMAKG
jgi:hypothetical protein